MWPDGIPVWLGGSGDEWLYCCVDHDLGGTDIELYQCVADAGYEWIALLMLVGLLTIGTVVGYIGRRDRDADK